MAAAVIFYISFGEFFSCSFSNKILFLLRFITITSGKCYFKIKILAIRLKSVWNNTRKNCEVSNCFVKKNKLENLKSRSKTDLSCLAVMASQFQVFC